MKFCNQILALCVFGAVGSNAFVTQSSKAASSALKLGPNGEPSYGYGSDRYQSQISYPSYVPGGQLARVGPAGTLFRNKEVNEVTYNMRDSVRNVWETLRTVTIQGGALRTWSFQTPSVERVQVLLKSEGRPIKSTIEIWQGPDNTPLRCLLDIEDGDFRPFSAIIETPRVMGSSVAIYNTSPLEYPLEAAVEAEQTGTTMELASTVARLVDMSTPTFLQGGSIQTFPFDPSVTSVQVMLTTDGRPLNARVELLQGPNTGKQSMEIYSEDGMERPFFAIVETPGSNNVVRIVNTAPVEFPLLAQVEPYLIDQAVMNRAYVDGDPLFMITDEM